MLDIFKKPYPPCEGNKQNLLVSIGVGAFIGLFLLFFQPFGIDNLDIPYKSIKILGYGFITFLTILIFHYFLPKLTINFMDDRNWTVGHEILKDAIMVLFIAIFNSIYSNFITQDAFSLSNLVGMIGGTFSIAIFPTTFLILLEHNRNLRKHVSEVNQLNLKQDKTPSSVKNLSILNPGSTESLTICPDHFLYAEADRNYVTIVQQKNDGIQKDLFRTTLTKLIKQIPVKSIIKCHRSYIVNLEKVIEVNGNAQGFKLQLKGLEEKVPVSRTFVPSVKNYFSAAS